MALYFSFRSFLFKPRKKALPTVQVPRSGKRKVRVNERIPGILLNDLKPVLKDIPFVECCCCGRKLAPSDIGVAGVTRSGRIFSCRRASCIHYIAGNHRD